jgi:hypothetical protein
MRAVCVCVKRQLRCLWEAQYISPWLVMFEHKEVKKVIYLCISTERATRGCSSQTYVLEYAYMLNCGSELETVAL